MAVTEYTGQTAAMGARPTKFKFRKLDPVKFAQLLQAARLDREDYLLFTGRHPVAIAKWLVHDGPEFSPIMADIMILELCARDPSIADRMREIAREYSLDH